MRIPLSDVISKFTVSFEKHEMIENFLAFQQNIFYSFDKYTEELFVLDKQSLTSKKIEQLLAKDTLYEERVVVPDFVTDDYFVELETLLNVLKNSFKIEFSFEGETIKLSGNVKK